MCIFISFKFFLGSSQSEKVWLVIHTYIFFSQIVWTSIDRIRINWWSIRIFFFFHIVWTSIDRIRINWWSIHFFWFFKLSGEVGYGTPFNGIPLFYRHIANKRGGALLRRCLKLFPWMFGLELVNDPHLYQKKK